MKNIHSTKKYISFFIAVLLLFTSFPLASGITANAASGGDLMLTNVAASLSTVYADDPVYFYAVVRNVGTATVTAGSTIRFYRDGFKVEDVELTEDIPANRMKTVRTTITKPVFFGSHLLSVKVLPAEGVDVDDTNNFYRSRLIVADEDRPVETVDPFDDPDYNVTQPGETLGAAEESLIPATAWTHIEAETGTPSGAAHTSTTNNGYTGDGYISSLQSGASVAYTYNAAAAGNYVVKLKYANGHGNGNMNTKPYYVYGTVSSGGSSANVSFRNSYETLDNRVSGETGAEIWNSWRYTQATIALSAGENTITVAGTGETFNLDFIEVAPAPSTQLFTSFWFKSADNGVFQADGTYVSGLKYDIQCAIGDDGVISAKIPTTVDISDLVATYTLSNDSYDVYVQGVKQYSGQSRNDFTNGQYYTVNGVTYKVKLEYLADSKLPNVFIKFDRDNYRNAGDSSIKQATEANIAKLFNSTSKADKDGNVVECYFTAERGSQSDIINPTGMSMVSDSKMVNLPASISIRGNSTLELEKKPYKLKLDKKANILDMSKSKNWILLASYSDKTMMRQYMGYELGRILNSQGIGYSPRTHYVNTFIDGKYNGVYIFMESIKVADDRVAMISAEDLMAGESYTHFWDPTDVEVDAKGKTSQRSYAVESTDTSGGYIMEFDERQRDASSRDEEFVFESAYGWYAVKEPDVTQEHANAAAGYINAMNTAINSGNWSNVTSKIDPTSFADWYIIMEIFKNQDAREYSSVYLTKISNTEASIEGGPHYQADGKGRIYMGPIWDFDISSGNIDYGYNDVAQSTKNTSGYYIRGGLWWDELFAYSEFKTIVRERYAYLLTQLSAKGGIGGFIQDTADYLSTPLSDNFDRWFIQTYAWPEPKIYNNYNSYVSDFKTWMTNRMRWLTSDNFS